MKLKTLLAGITGASVLILAQQAVALPVTFSSSSGTLAASATFDVNVNNKLVVTLANTSSADVLNPSQVLTGLFFDLNGVGALTPVSALLNGSTVRFGPTGGGNVGGEWAYASGLSGAPLGATEGISSAGLGLFGSPNFNGSNLAGPVAVDGLNYGITSAGDRRTTGNAEVTGNVPLIKSWVTFTLSGLPGGYDSSDLSVDKVYFQYGTALTCSPPPSVADGGSAVMLLGLALSGLAVVVRRSSRPRA